MDKLYTIKPEVGTDGRKRNTDKMSKKMDTKGVSTCSNYRYTTSSISYQLAGLTKLSIVTKAYQMHGYRWHASLFRSQVIVPWNLKVW